MTITVVMMTITEQVVTVGLNREFGVMVRHNNCDRAITLIVVAQSNYKAGIN